MITRRVLGEFALLSPALLVQPKLIAQQDQRETRRHQLFFFNFRADEPTPTGRVYPRAVLEKAIAKYQEKIRVGKALGTVPSDSEFIRPELDDVAFKLTWMWMWTDGKMAGAVTFLDTPKGKPFMEEGATLGLSLTTCCECILESNNVIRECTIINTSFVNNKNELICDDLQVSD